MIDPDAPIDRDRLNALRRGAVNALGVFFDSRVVERITDCIVEKVRHGEVDEGITYRTLVSDSGTPSWVAYQGVIGSVLALVSLLSYERDGVLLSALTRATDDEAPPTEEFCRFLEALGVVSSCHRREECLELWDHHWKKAISCLESRWLETKRPRL